MSEHVSDLRWDRLLAGELADDAKAASLAHASTCAECGARLAELTRQRDAFAQPLAPRRASRWWLAVPAVLAAAAAIVLVVRIPRDEPGERPKGSGPSFVVTAGPRDRVAPVASGDRVRPGDTVQVAYSAARDGFGAVLGRDGSGRTSIYVPSRGDAMIALPAGELRSFPESLVLDAVPGDEVLLVVWCETARPLAPYLAAFDAPPSASPGSAGARSDADASRRSTDGCWSRRIVLAKAP